MPTTQIVSVSSTTAFQSTGPDGATITVQNIGPDSCYYAVASTVSSGSNDGTLASGASISFFPGKFFISAGTSRLAVTSASAGEQLRQYDRDFAQSGMYAPSAPCLITSLGAVTANEASLARFVPSRNMTIASIAFHVQTGGADVACDVGIYSADLLTRLGVSTAATGRLNSAGVKNIALVSPVTLKAGVIYYAAFSANTGTTATLTQAAFLGPLTASLFGTTAGKVELDYKAASHPLPATLTVTGSNSGVPFLALRES